MRGFIPVIAVSAPSFVRFSPLARCAGRRIEDIIGRELGIGLVM